MCLLGRHTTPDSEGRIVCVCVRVCEVGSKVSE